MGGAGTWVVGVDTSSYYLWFVDNPLGGGGGFSSAATVRLQIGDSSQLYAWPTSNGGARQKGATDYLDSGDGPSVDVVCSSQTTDEIRSIKNCVALPVEKS